MISSTINRANFLKILSCRSTYSSWVASLTDEKATKLEALANEVITSRVSRSTETDAETLCKLYHKSDHNAKRSFLLSLSTKYPIDVPSQAKAAQAFLNSKATNGSSVLGHIEKLRKNSYPEYHKLFSLISKIPFGIQFLVGMRSDILDMKSAIEVISNNVAAEKINALDIHLKGLLSYWFSAGLATLERVTWNSPASLLEKVSQYEAVHPMNSWGDLKRRVGPNRRVYVFTHKSLPNEPLVILHIALVPGISSKIDDIVPSMVAGDFVSNKSTVKGAGGKNSMREEEVEEDLSQVNAAIFYSISSPQKGLQGIELGTAMIREVARKMSAEFPGITEYSSLSPIPGFKDFLLSQIQSVIEGRNSQVPNFVNSSQLSDLHETLLQQKGNRPSEELGESGQSSVWQLLHDTIQSNSWISDEQLSRKLYLPLMTKCTHYLYTEKKQGFALNPVAHFHMKNGSVMWRLNWRADMSARGLSNSCGIMVNYRYYIEDVEINSQRYIEDNVIPVSELFKSFLTHDPASSAKV